MKWRTVGGIIVSLGGAALIVVDSYNVYRLKQPPHYFHLGLGIVLLWSGAYAMVPALADEIAKRVRDYLTPFIPKLQFGRRSTDVPIQPDDPVAPGTPVPRDTVYDPEPDPPSDVPR